MARNSKGLFETKGSLREEDVSLTHDLIVRKRQYQRAYRPVQRLETDYLNCKRHFVLLRYGELKTMIKSCVTEENLEEAARLAAGRPSQDPEPKSLVAASKAFADAAADASIILEEISVLDKAGIRNDIEEKTKRTDHLETMFVSLLDRLQELQRAYDESKRRHPAKRYSIMKAMVKRIIRDPALKVDS